MHLDYTWQLHHHTRRICASQCCALRTRVSLEKRRKLSGSYASKKRLVDRTTCNHSTSWPQAAPTRKSKAPVLRQKTGGFSLIHTLKSPPLSFPCSLVPSFPAYFTLPCAKAKSSATKPIPSLPMRSTCLYDTMCTDSESCIYPSSPE